MSDAIPSAAESQSVAHGVRKTPLINREQVRRRLLEHAAATRAQKFTRVSEETLLNLNEALRAAIVYHVAHFPSKGETL